jgi:hypothetical protein
MPDLTYEILLTRIQLSIFIFLCCGWIACIVYSHITLHHQKKREDILHKKYIHLINNLKKTYTTKFENLHGRSFFSELVHYCETFVITKNYKSLDEILDTLQLTYDEKERIKMIVYKKEIVDHDFEYHIKKKIKNLTHI